MGFAALGVLTAVILFQMAMLAVLLLTRSRVDVSPVGEGKESSHPGEAVDKAYIAPVSSAWVDADDMVPVWARDDPDPLPDVFARESV